MASSSDVVNQAIADFGSTLDAALRREISVEEAEERVASPALAEALPDQFLSSNAVLAEEASLRDWRPSIKGIRIVIAALQATPPENRSLAVRTAITVAHMDIVGRACSDVPDGRLFHPAVSMGKSLAGEAEAAGETDLAGQLLHALGLLHLVPYMMGGFITSYDQQAVLWKGRLNEEYGLGLTGIAPEEIDLPMPRQAITEAQNYFRSAGRLREGRDLAKSLKYFAQASFFLEYLGGSVDRAEVGTAVEQALSLFSATQDPALYADLQLFQSMLGNSSTLGDSEEAGRKLLDEPLEQTVSRLGFGSAVDQYTALIRLEQTRSPALALRLWLKVGPLIDNERASLARASHLTLGCRLIWSVYGDPKLDLKNGQLLSSHANQILAALAAERIDANNAAAALVALASVATDSNSENQGLQFLRAARQTRAQWLVQFGGPVLYLDACLHDGRGATAYGAGYFAEAALEFIRAASTFSDLQLSSMALAELQKAEVSIDRVVGTLNGVVAALATHAIRIQAGTGPAGIEVLRRLCDAVLPKVVEAGPADLNAPVILWQVIKGAAFSSALQHPPVWRWDQDQTALELLRQVRLAESQVAREAGWASKHALDESALLVAYTSPSEVSAGSDAAAILEYSRHAFDSFVSARILVGGLAGRPPFMEYEELRAALDARTVLVNQLLGPSRDGMDALYTMIATREDVTFTCGVNPWSNDTLLVMDQEGRRMEGDYMMLSLQAVRRSVMDNNSAGMKELEWSMPNYLGGSSMGQLSVLRAAGKDHICFVPHGPMHSYPFHLLGAAESPLAADWKVTYLPSMSMLAVPQAVPAAKINSTGLRSFGVDWEEGNAAGLQPMDNASAEASDVAEQFGVAPDLNQEATKAALLEALTSARMVHVATHGNKDVIAPAFQTIYMSATGNDRGVLAAYEVIGLDLRGCDLVTLSACETALVRFDRLDNIRGLSASLFMAGVKTIIGTLWQVESHCAQYFFSFLYERLRQGDTKLDAFWTAQTSARQFYPEYRDWGAFYYAGRW